MSLEPRSADSQPAVPPLLVINGPTASGKSGVAIHLAERLASHGLPAEIVNADSMLIYRRMDIGTAKPTIAEQQRVRHHLIDIADIAETAAVADFQTAARAVIADCRARGVIPILAGGSALYVRAIIDDFVFPGSDPQLRRYWEEQLVERGPVALHQELTQRAPEAASRILPSNGRRIVRALEIAGLDGEATGQLPEPRYALPAVIQFGLQIDRTNLDRRIAERVDQMWTAGFVDEVRALAADGLAEAPTASKALGYRQLLAHLDGDYSAAEARLRTEAATRRFARKQFGWFGRDPRIRWHPALAEDLAGLLLADTQAHIDAQDWDHA